MTMRPLALLVILAACQTSRPQSSIYSANSRDDEVLNAEHGWVNATMRQDADAFGSFLDDKWVGLIDGKLIDKAQWTNEIRAVLTSIPGRASVADGNWYRVASRRS